MVKFSETDHALEEMKREYDDIEFVISEAEEDQVVNRVEEGERARKEIFVYSMVWYINFVLVSLGGQMIRLF